MINAQSAAPFTPSTGPVPTNATTTPVAPQPASVMSTPPAPVASGIPMTPPPVIGTPPSMDSISNSKPPQKKGMSKNFKIALAALLLLVVVAGSGVGLYLNQQSQDVRQQADEIKPSESPIVRPPETVAPPVSSAVCSKTAYEDQGAGQLANLVQTKSFNSSQIVHFKVAVTKNISQIIPLSITDDFSEFTRAGYVFESAEVEGGKVCSPDEGFNRDNPSFYKCTWSGAAQGETLNLHIRLRPTVNYVIEPEKVEANNKASVDLCELCGPGGGGALTENEVPSRNEPTTVPGSNNCSATVLIPGNTGVIPTPVPDKLSCNSACIPVPEESRQTADPCTQSLGSSYACTQVIDRPASEDIPTHRCRLKLDPTSESCQVLSAASPTPTATPTVGCNQTCSTNADCSNPNHVCSDQNGSKVCRLSSNVNNSSCSSPTSTTGTATPTPTMSTSTGGGSQPTLPAELPQTGAGDINNWVKAGLGTLGLGILFLLLL